MPSKMSWHVISLPLPFELKFTFLPRSCSNVVMSERVIR
jgi:hypothetical protein